jgi:isoleucyl-tRNA synthetase
MGRWINFGQDYKTMYPWFMESVWFIFKQLYNKGYVYRGFKVRRIFFLSKFQNKKFLLR